MKVRMIIVLLTCIMACAPVKETAPSSTKTVQITCPMNHTTVVVDTLQNIVVYSYNGIRLGVYTYTDEWREFPITCVVKEIKR